MPLVEQPSDLQPDPAWDEWFELQYGLCRELDQRLDQALRGKPKPLRVAVQAALLEHLAERIRGDIDLPDHRVNACKHPIREYGQWWFCRLPAGHDGSHRPTAIPAGQEEPELAIPIDPHQYVTELPDFPAAGMCLYLVGPGRICGRRPDDPVHHTETP